jgi:hypothetical protein
LTISLLDRPRTSKTLYTLASIFKTHNIKKQEKWLDDDLMAIATILHNMKYNIIHLFEEHETTKRMMKTLD